MENNKSYRAHTNINSDTLLHVHLRQDMDFLEVLSLKLKQEDLYKLHTSNYGVLIGRVLASESFGIPNVKVSLFVKLDDIDSKNTEITNIYPYTDTSSKDRNGIRYNLLPDSMDDDCYRIVGTFPNKRLVLDENTYLEIFDKYWKYTTITNKAGDYFIPHVPVGEVQLHIDFDISDVGILSQRPRDMVYKGYNITLFDNANQFKEDTNLDSLTQIFSQNQSVYVYPFWGEEDLNEIAITRCDMNVQYKFEPTCIFMGSIVSDSFGTAIGHNCKAFRTSGYNKTLVAGEGTIEMIRKTTDGFVEEFQIQGNQLIDGDGVFCYQIPMNLDYVQTDEYGNIIPTDNPAKGIPTRTSVRFRFSMNETENDGISRHRAKYLVPNNPKLKVDYDEEGNLITDKIYPVELGTDYTLDSYYEFGTATNEDSFRDLFWNKVYTVKNYIPRIQVSKKANTKNYTGLRTSNNHESNNPVPFNKIRFSLSFQYRLSCILATIVLKLICFINKIIIAMWNTLIGFLCKLCLPLGFIKLCPFGFLCKLMIPCIEFPFLTEADEGSCEVKCFFPCCTNGYSQDETYDENPDCETIETDQNVMKQKLEQLLAEENDAVNLDFYNDWLNGCLYMPLWYWRKRKKRRFFFGLFSRKAVNAFCNCDKGQKTRLMWPCAFRYKYNFQTNDLEITTDLKQDHMRWHDKELYKFDINYGFVKEKETKSGLLAYYYAPGIRRNPIIDEQGNEDMSYAVLFATDIVLLGSLNDCDLNGVPQMFINLPSTTSNIMPVNRDVERQCDTEDDAEIIQETTGMDFWTDPEDNNEMVYKGNGYFMDIGCSTVETLPKTCVNAERLSELGVSLDQSFSDEIAGKANIEERQNYADGMITRVELVDNETRSMFATLNHNGLQNEILDKSIGYYFYRFKYLFPIEFDGRMRYYCEDYTKNANEGRVTTDWNDRSYLLFRLGKTKFFYDTTEDALQFPIYNNSFYFYFGKTEGKTAIEKFKTKFFSTCFQNVKEPFSIDIKTTNASWYTKKEGCEDVIEEKLGKIEVTFKGISVPYKYTIKNSFGEELLKDIECSREALIFENFFDKEFGEDEENTTCVELAEGEKGNQLPIVNDTYTIIVTNAKGETLSKKIELSNIPISLGYSTRDLGLKFYENQTKKADICDVKDMSGGILINSVTIDSVIYQINSNTFNEPKQETYTRTIIDENNQSSEAEDIRFVLERKEKDEDGYLVKIIVEIIPNQKNNINTSEDNENVTTETVNLFKDCMCDLNPLEDFWNENGLFIPIWVPQSYKVKVTQIPYSGDSIDDLCDDEVENSSSNNFVVLNGKPFDMVLNDVLLKFIDGKFYDNENFSILDDGKVQPKNESSNLFGWFNINKEVLNYGEGNERYVYAYDEFEELEQNHDYWEDAIDDLVFTNGNEATDTTYDNILIYKLQSLLNLSNATFVQADDFASFKVTVKGGRKPNLAKSMLPEYESFTTNENLDENDLFQTYVYGSDTTVQNDNLHPTIVGWNYKYYYPTDNVWKKMYKESDGYGVNLLYNDNSHIGNYFAVFSDNGGMTVIGDDCVSECLTGQTIYNQAPFDANPKPYNGDNGSCLCLNGEIEDYEYYERVYKKHTIDKIDYLPYFRTQFIDRRLDYNMIVMTPYNGENLIEIGNTKFDWTKGRISGTTINGIELAYRDSDYNIFNKEDRHLEYSLQDNGRDKAPIIIYNNDIRDKKFYRSEVKCGVNTFDYKKEMWAYDNETNFLRKPEVTATFDAPIPQKPFSVDKTQAYIQANTNGDFNQKNYPIKRLFDVAQIQKGVKMEFMMSSCSYGKSTINYDSLNNMQCISGEGDKLQFSVANDKSIQIMNPEFEDCVGNSYANVEFESELPNGTEFTESIFRGQTVTFKFKILQDTEASHNIRTRIPRLARIIDDENDNPIKEIKIADTEDRINEIITKIPELSIIEKPENVDKMTWNGWIDGRDWNYLGYTDGSSNIPVEDDTIEFANTIFGCLSNRYKVGNLEIKIPYYVEDARFLCTVLDREYFNDDARDFLQKTIRVINTSNMFDVRPFEWACTFAGKDIVQDNSQESDGSVTIPDGEGGSTTGDVEISNSAVTQVIKYELRFNSDDYNQVFQDISDMHFAVKYRINGTDYVIDNLIPLTNENEDNPDAPTEDNVLVFVVPWNGIMKNIFLTPNISTQFYIKTKSGLIYALYFIMRGLSEDDNVMISV